MPPRFFDFPDTVAVLTGFAGVGFLAIELFWFSTGPPVTLRSSKGMSDGMGNPDLCLSMTSLESWKRNHLR